MIDDTSLKDILNRCLREYVDDVVDPVVNVYNGDIIKCITDIACLTFMFNDVFDPNDIEILKLILIQYHKTGITPIVNIDNVEVHNDMELVKN